MRLQGIVTSVCYDDLLAFTLRKNVKHFARLCVVTAPFDHKTIAVVERIKQEENAPGLFTHITDAFYRDGAVFNKGAAIEEVLAGNWAGDMWSVIFDADILMPDNLRDELYKANLQRSDLYVPRRLQVDKPEQIGYADGVRTLAALREIQDAEHAGFFQMFHPTSPHLATRPWYGMKWKHAGGADSDFMHKFPPAARHWLPFHVYHLGAFNQNWHGRITPRWDGEQAAEGSPITGDQSREFQASLYSVRRARRLLGKDPHSNERLP